MLELALGGTFLTLLLAAVIGYGPMFYNAIELSGAARAGAVYGSQDSKHAADTTGMQNIAIANAPNVKNPTATAQRNCYCSGSSASCSSTCAGAPPQIYVTVTTQATSTPILPYPLAGGSTFTITRTVKMRAR